MPDEAGEGPSGKESHIHRASHPYPYANLINSTAHHLTNSPPPPHQMLVRPQTPSAPPQETEEKGRRKEKE